MNEIWKEIEGYPNYMVSNCGKVRSKEMFIEVNGGSYIKKGRLLKGDPASGYIRVALFNTKNKEVYPVHRLVGKAFIPNPYNKPFINHINGIKTDNRVENLEWVTNSENQIHAIKTGLRKDNIKKVRCIETNQIFDSAGEADRFYGKKDKVNKVANPNDNHRKAFGYSWEYIKE